MRGAPPLELVVQAGEATRLTIVVHEGDNRALPITAVRLLLPSWRIRFFHPSGPLHLVYGRDDISPPQYDLALLAPAVLGAEARPVTAAAESSAASTPQTLVAPRTFYIGIGVAVVILLGLIAKLLKGQPSS
jgi:hypothetical protein